MIVLKILVFLLFTETTQKMSRLLCSRSDCNKGHNYKKI